MLFPRWTGPDGDPSKLMGKISLINYVKIYNGRKQCLVSVYSFGKFRNHKPYIGSAVIDTLYTRGEPEKVIEYLRILDLIDVRYNAYYDGKEILLMVPLGCISMSLKNEIALASFLNIPFSNDRLGLMLWPRTWNPKARKFVVEITGRDKLEDLDTLASKSVKRVNTNKTLLRSLYDGGS